MSNDSDEQQLSLYKYQLGSNDRLQSWIKMEDVENEDYISQSDCIFKEEAEILEEVNGQDDDSDDLDAPSISSSAPMLDTPKCYQEATYLDEVRQHFTNSSGSSTFDFRLYENIIEEKCEPSELVEFRDKSWCICMRADLYSKGNDFEMVVYSFQKGIEKICLKSYQIHTEFKSASMLKYRRDEDRINIEPIHCSMLDHSWISVKVKMNRGMEVKCYAISNFVDFERGEGIDEEVIIWSDAIGAIRLNFNDLSMIRRNCGDVPDAFSALALSHITVKADFRFEHGLHPKWTITNIQPTLEMDDNQGTLKIGANLWPARLLRFDDLLFSNKEPKYMVFRSISMESVIVKADRNLFGIINSAGPKYAENGIMTAVVFPKFEHGEFAYYEAMIIGPLKVVMIITEGRLQNYTPKTWPPNVLATFESHKNREKFDKQNMPRTFPNQHSWDIPYSYTSIKGSYEI